MVGMQQQGAWMKWEEALDRKVSWAMNWQVEPQRHQVHGPVYDVLPSTANLHLWGKGDSPACSLYSGRDSLEHILSCCPKALAEGLYRLWYNQVLKVATVAISKTAANNNTKQHHDKEVYCLRQDWSEASVTGQASS